MRGDEVVELGIIRLGRVLRLLEGFFLKVVGSYYLSMGAIVDECF